MKKFLFVLFTFGYVSVMFAQETTTCCGLPATDAFARFASDDEFNQKHPNPIPYQHKSDVGRTIIFKAADGTDAYGYELKAEEPTDQYLFVIHEWWGLNGYIKKEAEKLYNDLGVNVIALDLYDHKIATNREEAAKYMQAVSKARAEAIIEGALNYVGNKADIYTIGWCFGGGWSLQTSIMAGKQAAGCVMYYGMPEKEVDRLKKLKTDVLGIFANKEKWITPEVVDTFAENMDKANKTLVLKRFDAEHAFANPSNPQYDKEATEAAYKATISFLQERID
ncbi:MAG: dienelactone hydrolase family protein [Thermonemataceae bacterium]